jgi:uncharacterized protein YdeI (YjbR/CyaY-like superfamily)
MSEKTGAKRSVSTAKTERPLRCAGLDEWRRWLASNHASSSGVWLLIAKQGGTARSPTYAEALEGALAWGWIDSQKKKHDESAWLQRFSPRTSRSPWSKINRDKATALIRAGRMEPPGLAEVQRAKKDGRWNSAYDSARTSTVPADLAAALAKNKRAAAFFATLDAANRYAILWRLQTAVKAETRAKRLATFVAMLAKHERIHPLGKRATRKPTRKSL